MHNAACQHRLPRIPLSWTSSVSQRPFLIMNTNTVPLRSGPHACTPHLVNPRLRWTHFMRKSSAGMHEAARRQCPDGPMECLRAAEAIAAAAPTCKTPAPQPKVVPAHIKKQKQGPCSSIISCSQQTNMQASISATAQPPHQVTAAAVVFRKHSPSAPPPGKKATHQAACILGALVTAY